MFKFSSYLQSPSGGEGNSVSPKTCPSYLFPTKLPGLIAHPTHDYTCGFILHHHALHSAMPLRQGASSEINPPPSKLSAWPAFIHPLFIYLFIFAFSRAALAAYGGSQARCLIGAVAAGLHQSHSNAGSESCLQPTPQLTATPDP